MPKHALIASAYALLAVAVALVLPAAVPGASHVEAVLAGALVGLAGLIAHEAWTRSEAAALAAGRLQALREHQMALRHDIDRMQGEILRLDGSLATLAEEGDSRAKRDLDRVVSEVRVLQGLIERLSGAGQGDDDDAGAVPRPAPAAAQVRHELDEVQVLDLVREGLRRDRVDLYLQPIVSLPQRKIRFYECFSRIRAEDGAIVLPEQYLDVAKREGLMGAIDNLLLFRCVQLVRRAQSHNHALGFFCNISANTLADRAFFADFVDFMASNTELARNLIFEFRQDDLAERGDEVGEYIARLGRLGFSFSLDRVHDLARLEIPALARRRFKYLKIEAGYLLQRAAPGGTTDEPGGDTATLVGVDAQALKRVLDLHGIDLIAEKIEAEQDLVELLDFRIDYGQGYLFGEPRLAKEA